MVRKLRVGSRESKLAVVQSQIIIDCIKKHHPDLEIEFITMKTTGDKILDKALDKIGGKGLFVKELDKALIENKIDIAIHSLKDMPMEINKELPIIAYSKREDPRDVLILPKDNLELNPDRPIGCSSLRRTLQIKKLYPDMQIKPIRGNVLTRLDKLDQGEFSALILAAAGIKRLKLEERITKEFTIQESLPAAGQGILAIQGRKGEDYSFLSCVNDNESEIAALCERAFVRELNGGCSSPIAAFATIENERIVLNCMYEDGKKMTFYDEPRNAEELGRFAANYKTPSKGKVWLVGAGPSDPELLTVKGKRLIENAEVVVYDRLVGDGILSLISKKAKKIYVGKESGNHAVRQDRINEILLEEACKGQKVVRLKGGDPFVFGRGGEELELLVKHNIPFEIVPGITSSIAVAAYNGIPVTYRDFCSSLHIITGHKKKDEPLDIDFEALVRTKGTLVFLMSVASLKDICEGLLQAGMKPTMPAAILENGTKAHQRKVISTVSELSLAAEKAEIKSPSIIVVGEVCSLSDKFSWYDKNVLSGCKVAVTRPKELSSKLSELLREKGAEVLEIPCIVTERIPNNETLYSCMKEIENFQWIVLTSPTGARIFFEELSSYRVDIRKLNQLKFAVIGKGTSQVLEDKGIYPELMPKVYQGKELGGILSQSIKEGDKILIPRARQGAKELIEELSKTKCIIYDIPTYDTLYQESMSELKMEFENAEIDYAIFTSASTVKGFAQAHKNLNLKKVKAICIGQKTKQTADEYQMQTYVSKEATLESLVECLEQQFQNKEQSMLNT
ncbi:hydroxymethylbilane synthase [Lachnotalea glycerini]|uniref:Porphobilinogen deaminase n=1 Tax=Lachnotalea glycerini TaxID=1763509 RepID=A0A318ES57_9FIRM|nr:uroporphyrinogen-III C-methyltransferase [Lachnotalea glycerini]PXV95791.1 hydroxymethylbilane synthase [Lachnotalea glycerini]